MKATALNDISDFILRLGSLFLSLSRRNQDEQWSLFFHSLLGSSFLNTSWRAKVEISCAGRSCAHTTEHVGASRESARYTVTETSSFFFFLYLKEKCVCVCCPLLKKRGKETEKEHKKKDRNFFMIWWGSGRNSEATTWIVQRRRDALSSLDSLFFSSFLFFF